MRMSIDPLRCHDLSEMRDPQRTDGLKTFKNTLKSLMFPLFGVFWISNIFRHIHIHV